MGLTEGQISLILYMLRLSHTKKGTSFNPFLLFFHIYKLNFLLLIGFSGKSVHF